MNAIPNIQCDEHSFGGEVWIALRGRNAETVWLRPTEAAALGKELTASYGTPNQQETLK